VSDAPPTDPSAATQDPEAHGHGSTAALALAALGIVYGDIGTSPLYAIKECFHGAHAIGATEGNILGVLSLVFWSLSIVVALKYLTFIMRADNHGEGGIFALLALVPPDQRLKARLRGFVVLLAVFSAALLYGDGIITPAISVLSAVEGLGVATDAMDRYVVPITCGILIGLFSVQKKGTAGIAKVFGPVMIAWFSVLAVLGVRQILANPHVLTAMNPLYAIEFFRTNGMHGFIVLGSVVLCITGGEALYADMGHFGRKPIQMSWFAIVMPALLLNYFGQGALLLADASAHVLENPFYGMVPRTFIYPMVGLATAATVIASQALISGAFSLTRQAIQLGFLPRMHIIHTSGETEGQIYIPLVNSAMAVACLALVLAFRSSSNLAAAYGLAVTIDMCITSAVFFFVARYAWNWPMWRAAGLVGLFLVFDLLYFGSNALKFFDGGWLPVVVGFWLLATMLTWRDGRRLLAESFSKRTLPFDLFLDDVKNTQPHRVRGTAVFMFSSPTGTSPVLLHHLKHNQVLHEQVVMLSIQSERRPYVHPSQQLTVESLGEGFYRLTAHFGYMESPNVPTIMARATLLGLKTTPETTSFFLGRETLLTSGPAKMLRVRKILFSLISRNAQSATAFFGLPPGRVVELGMQIDL
jgi:KUP system potassium uptake protein